jgi:formamidopyrimidine-DNA glycosylase
MPELPEVETIRLCLLEKVVGQRINKVRVKSGSRLLRDTVSAAALRRGLRGKTIEAVSRRGKYLIFALSSGDFMVVHLGMSGRLYAQDKEERLPDHAHLRLELDECALILVDPRTFGRVFLVRAGKLDALPALARLGPEPLDTSFTLGHIKDAVSRRSAPIKAVLLDQSVVAGVGNIYADESCFCAGVNPLRPASTLRDREIRALRRSIRSVLRQSIRRKGTTIRDYKWDAGRSGDFAKMLKVYGKEGETCLNCRNEVKREVVAGRSTYFCAGCQK